MAEEGDLTEVERQIIDYAIHSPEKFTQLSDLIESQLLAKAQGRRKPEYISRLIAAFERLASDEKKFDVGSLVRWKTDLKNRRRPDYDEPVVVIEIVDPPVLASEVSSGSTYYREPLDLVIGLLDEEDSELIVFHVDSRRFEQFHSK